MSQSKVSQYHLISHESDSVGLSQTVRPTRHIHSPIDEFPVGDPLIEDGWRSIVTVFDNVKSPCMISARSTVPIITVSKDLLD